MSEPRARYGPTGTDLDLLPAEVRAMLVNSLRQYRHNDGKGLVFAYDKEMIEAMVVKLVREGVPRE